MELSVQRIRERYFKPKNLPARPNLPIVREWPNILRTIESHPVTILTGSTGCGKSTQVPQLLLEEMICIQGKPCNIVVTQPRRLAAISVCKTVCKDRRWEVGSICGYQVGLDRQLSSHSHILYATTDVVGKSIVGRRSLGRYTHIIIDEIHERKQELDCLLYLLKTFTSTSHASDSSGDQTDGREHFPKIILMSATAETSVYSEYFGKELCGFVNVEGSLYEVEKIYLDKLPPEVTKRMAQATIIWHARGNSRNKHKYSLKRQHFLGVLNLIHLLDDEEANTQTDRGAVLIFVPGIAEIRLMTRVLNEDVEARRYFVVPLHSNLPLEMQGLAFRRAPPGHRKIIISTNIAESSVTVRDIRYVIDFCLTKTLVLDRESGASAFLVERCSKASCAQRAGRAGRVQNGRVYRLIAEWEYEKLQDYSTPEIARAPVEKSVLKVKVLGLATPKEALANFITPPDPRDVSRAIIQLKEAQALQLEHNGKVDLDDGDLTIIGHVMAALPVDIYLAKLILMGFAFGCFEECVKMASCLNGDGFFERNRSQNTVSHNERRLLEYQNMLSWAGQHFSDPIMLVNVFDEFIQVNEEYGEDNANAREKWANQHNLSLQRLSEAYYLYEELKARVVRLGFVWRNAPNRKPIEPSMMNLFTTIALCGAFYPHYFALPRLKYEDTSANCGDQNPFNTMVISGLTPRFAPLYEQVFRSTLADCIKSSVQFTWKGMDAFLSFGNSSVHGGSSYGSTQIPIDMYLCEKFSRIHEGIQVPKIEPRIAEQLLRKSGLAGGADDDNNENNAVVGDEDTRYRLIVQDRLPKQMLPAGRSQFRGTISRWHEEDVFTLFLHINDRAEDFKNLCREIGSGQFGETSAHPIGGEELALNTIVLARHDGELHRARVVHVYKRMNKVDGLRVFLVDDGLTADVPLQAVYELPSTMLLCNHEGPFAYKAQLAYVQSPDGRLVPPKSRHRLLRGKSFHMKLVSIVDDVMRIELFITDDDEEGASINEQLIHDRLAMRMDERTASVAEPADAAPETVSSTRTVVLDKMIYFDDFDTVRTRFHGPYSPLCQDLEPFSLKQRYMNKKFIEVTDDSVNQVLFADTGHNRRFLVAHAQRLTPEKDRLQLMRTTLVSNLKMALPFVTLAFAPRAEYHRNCDHTAYIGAICGLGGYEAGDSRGPYDQFVSASPSNDLEVPFTHEMTTREARLINRVRRLLNEVFGGNNETFEWSDLPLTKMQNKLHEAIVKFFNADDLKVREVGPRRGIPQTKAVRRSAVRNPYTWTRPTREQQRESDEISRRHKLFRPHTIVPLKNKACNNILELLLDFKSAGKGEQDGMVLSLCPLCLVICASAVEIREHLVCEEHCKSEQRLIPLQ